MPIWGEAVNREGAVKEYDEIKENKLKKSKVPGSDIP
jgi:hypothetical protein